MRSAEIFSERTREVRRSIRIDRSSLKHSRERMCPSLRGRTDRAAIGDRSSSRKISASVERSSRSLRAIEDREEVLRGSIRDRSRSHVDPYAMSKPTWRDSTRAPLAHDQRSECDRVLTMIVMTIDDESPRIRSRSMPGSRSRTAIPRSRIPPSSLPGWPGPGTGSEPEPTPKKSRKKCPPRGGDPPGLPHVSGSKTLVTLCPEKNVNLAHTYTLVGGSGIAIPGG